MLFQCLKVFAVDQHKCPHCAFIWRKIRGEASRKRSNSVSLSTYIPVKTTAKEDSSFCLKFIPYYFDHPADLENYNFHTYAAMLPRVFWFSDGNLFAKLEQQRSKYHTIQPRKHCERERRICHEHC